jgi:non-ribosomal peptide synthetase component E (peptide arylation enzyme)
MNTENEVTVHGGKSEKSSRSQLLLDTSNQARVSVKKNPDNNAYIQLHGGTPGQN